MTPGPVVESLIHGRRPQRQAVPGRRGDDRDPAARCAVAGLLTARRRAVRAPGLLGDGGGLARGGDEPPGLHAAQPAAAGGRRVVWTVLLDYLTGAATRRDPPRRGRRGAGSCSAPAGSPSPRSRVGARRPARRPAVAGRSRTRAGCCGCPVTRGTVPAGRRPGSPADGAVAGPERQTSTGSTPPWSCPPSTPKDWRLRIHGHGRPGGRRSPTSELLDAAAHRGLGDDLLRVQPGRRRPDRQRLVERRADRATCSRRPGVQPGADAVMQTSQDGWTCGTPLAALTDDRNAMLAIAMNGEPLPDRARLPGADGRARPLRLRLGDQVAGRPRGHPVRRLHGLLDRARLVGEGPGQDRVAHRRAPRRRRRSAPGRSGVGGHAWAQHTGIEKVEYRLDGGAWQEAELGPGARQRHLGAVGRHRRRRRRASTGSRCGPPTGPATRRPPRAPTSCPTARPAGTA